MSVMLPPSRVSPVALVSHTARSGRPLPDDRFHSDTFSASISALTIGTSADWFFLTVTGSLMRYSNRSPRDAADAYVSRFRAWSYTSRGIGSGAGGGGAGRPRTAPPPAPPGASLPVRKDGERESASAFSVTFSETLPTFRVTSCWTGVPDGTRQFS